MTIEEFDIMKFCAGMKATIKERTYDVASINFDQKLIGVISYNDVNEIDWYRCENVELHAKDLSLIELLDYFKTNNFQP